jgi:hypothetical protein
VRQPVVLENNPSVAKFSESIRPAEFAWPIANPSHVPEEPTLLVKTTNPGVVPQTTDNPANSIPSYEYCFRLLQVPLITSVVGHRQFEAKDPDLLRCNRGHRGRKRHHRTGNEQKEEATMVSAHERRYCSTTYRCQGVCHGTAAGL